MRFTVSYYFLNIMFVFSMMRDGSFDYIGGQCVHNCLCQLPLLSQFALPLLFLTDEYGRTSSPLSFLFRILITTPITSLVGIGGKMRV